MKNYDLNTENLVYDTLDFKIKMKFKYSFAQTVLWLRQLFKNKNFKRAFLGNLPYNEKEPHGNGFCFYGSYFIMQNTEQSDFWEMRRLNDDFHWFLVEKSTGKVFDLTYDTFDTPIDYSQSVPENCFAKATKKIKSKLDNKSNFMGIHANLIKE